MSQLDVFEGLPIPADYAPTQTYAVLARRDAGKTYLTARFEEQLCDVGAFFVVLDPVGKHWSLRAGPDGTPGGGKSDVWVLGGTRGDVPLEPGGGELIADVVLDHPGRYVIDVSTFETDSDQDRFVTAFAKRLFRRKAKDPGWPMTLILEEAESFIPEKPQAGQASMLGALGRIMRQGRNHGLGMWMVAQRAQALNKGVLSQAEVLIVKQMAHKRDRDAVDDWVKANGTPEQRDELMASLASLEQNEAWVWSPSWLRCFKRTTVLRRETFDASKSVKHGARARAVELVPLDVAALGERMSEVAERAKSDDPRELRRQIAAFQKKLEREQDASYERGYQQGYEKRAELDEGKVVEVPTLNEDELERVQGAMTELRAAQVEVAGTVAELSNALEMAIEIRKDVVTEPVRVPSAPIFARSSTSVAVADEDRQSSSSFAKPENNGDDGGYIPTGLALDILKALASVHPRTLTRRQLGALTGKQAESGYFSNTLSKLRTSGYLVNLEITQRGFDLVGRPDPLTSADLRRMWRDKVSGLPQQLFDLLCENPSGMSRSQLAEATGKEPNSGYFSNMLSKLRGLGIVENHGGVNRLVDELLD